MSDKEKLIKELIENEKTGFTEADKEWLSGLEEDRLEKFKPSEEKPEPKPGPEVKPEPTPVPEKKEAPKEEDSEKKFNEVLASAPLEFREQAEEGMRMVKEKKDKLIQGLMANKRNKFSEDELKGKKIGELEALASLAQVEVDYTGLGGGDSQLKDNEKHPDGSGVPDMPVIEFATK